MTEEAVRSDPVVETALRLLPVPDHVPGFWGELGTRLSAEAIPLVHEPALAVGPRLVAAPLATVEPPDALSAVELAEVAEVAALEAAVAVPAARRSAADPSLLLVPPALRRRSNAVLSLVAVAAAAVVVVAGATLVQQRSSGGEAAPASATGNPVSTAVASSSSQDEAASTAAVLAWVAAMEAGDTERAWDLLGPASQAHFGTRAAFAAEGTASEDYAAWASSAADDAVVMTVTGQGGSQVLVVTLVGSGERNGVRHRWAEAVPVRLVDGSRVVEPFAFAGEIDVEVPREGSTAEPLPVVSADDELVVIVPRGVDAPTLSIDGQAPVVCGAAAGTSLTQLEDAPGQRCTYRPAKGIAPGRSMLTVAFVAPDGLGIAAESVMFEAA